MIRPIPAFVVFSAFFVRAPLFAEQPMPPQDQNMWRTLVMLGVAVLFFYLILWRPEQKRRKTLNTLRADLKTGDRVVAMGILGTVTEVREGTVILSLCEGAKIEVLKGAVTEVEPE